MHMEKSRYGEDLVIYDTREEERAAIAAYLAHDYGALTLAEVEFFRSCERDPDNVKFDAEHAGMFAEDVDPLSFNGLVFIYDLGKTFEEGRAILLDIIGPHPITPLALWNAAGELAARMNKPTTDKNK